MFFSRKATSAILGNPRLGLNAGRQLHKFAHPRPEIVIGNNSALLGTLASLLKHGKPSHPDLKIIRPPFWLDRVLPEYYQENWGQTIWGLPQNRAGNLIGILPPLQKDRKSKTIHYLGSIHRTKRLCYTSLAKRFSCAFFKGDVQIKKTEHGEYQIDVKECGAKIVVPENTFFYNWHRTNRLHNRSDNLPNRFHTELYTVSRKDTPETIIVLGAGLSTVWLGRHFKDSKIICLKRPEDSLPHTPATSDVNYDRIKVINYETAVLTTSKQLNGRGGINVSSPELDKDVVGEFYTAIGFDPVRIQPGIIPDESIENLPSKYLKFISNQITPVGSLIQSYQVWLELTGNLSWAYEPQAYHVGKFPELLRQAAASHGVDLPNEYFDNLEETVLKLPYPVSEDEAFGILETVFLNTASRSQPADLKKQFESFKQALVELRKGLYTFEDSDNTNILTQSSIRRTP